MGTFVLGARVLLAAVFATAGVGKLLDRSGSQRALRDFGLPERAATIVGVVLPLAELAAAVALLFPSSARWGALAALVLVVAFIVGIARALMRGEAPDCHCFGQIHSAPAGKGTLARNAILAVLAGIVVWRGPGPSIVEWVGDRTSAELAAVAAGITAAVLGAIALRLWLDNRNLRSDLDDVSAQLRAIPPGLPIGVPAPGFELPDLEGETVTLDSLCARGRPVVLVFVGPDCGGCRTLFPELGRWQATLADRLSLVPVSNGTPEANRPVFEEHDISGVILQEKFEVLLGYRLQQTPTAVVVTAEPEPRMAAGPAAGTETIEALVRATLEREGAASGAGPVAAERPEV